jgi:hypothetical protein
MPRYTRDAGAITEGTGKQWWKMSKDPEMADKQEGFDKRPRCWTGIMKAPKIVRDTLTNRTTGIHQEWDREFTIEERNWARWVRDQKIDLRANEDRWISLRLGVDGTGGSGKPKCQTSKQMT